MKNHAYPGSRAISRAWSLVSLLCLASFALAAGCGDVESCKEATTPGCINTAPRDDGSCLFDLVLRNGKCVKSGGDEDKCGACPAGSLCDPAQNVCSQDFCAVPTALPGSVAPPEAIFCEAFKQDGGTDNPMLTFTEVCNRRCRLRCQRLAQFCPGYTCPAGSCDQPDEQTKCLVDCPLLTTGGQDLACLTRSCNDARFTRCGSTVTCPNGIASNCGSITCSNDCAFKLTNGDAVVGDGVCDDGEVLSSASPYCDWGSDCADCGPRMGTKAPAAGALGDLCEWAQNCADATGKPSTAKSWCDGLTTTKASRCMPDCSRGETCADGFGCFNVTFTDPETMMDAPVVEGALTSSACIPLACQ